MAVTDVAGSGKGESDGELGSPRSGGPATDDDGPAAKAPRTGRQYACPHCSYSADKKVSLNRHMRMHAPAAPCPSPSPVTPAAPSDSENTADEGTAGSTPLPPPPLDRYCADCDIRFSSVKTYRAHKMHYCSTRHVVKPPSAVSPAAASQVLLCTKYFTIK
jgi:zinc finger protein ZFPM1